MRVIGLLAVADEQGIDAKYCFKGFNHRNGTAAADGSSASIITDIHLPKTACEARAISLTLPLTGLWTGAETNASLFPTI